jgi:hypothetical protein
MKVQELIEALQNLNPESEVLIDDGRGGVYDMITSVLSLEETARRNYAEDYAEKYISWYQAEEGKPNPIVISFYR